MTDYYQPGIEELLNNISEITNANLSNKTYYEIDGMFYNKIPPFPVTWAHVRSEFSVIRIVKAHTPPDKLYKHQVSYPPKEFASLGRCNFLGEPVFYATDSIFTGTLECKLQVGDTFYLGKWNAKQPNKIKICTSFFSNYNGEVADYHRWKGVAFESLAINNFKSQSDYEYYKTVLKILTDTFLSTNTNLSAFLSRKVLVNSIANALVYPSVAEGRNRLNMAFSPEIIDEAFELENVFYVTITGLNEDIITYDNHSMIGRPSETGNIIWEMGGYEEFNSFFKLKS